MKLSKIKEKINGSPYWKSRLHYLMFCNARPRWWVKHILNPFIFHHGKGAVIRRQTVMNVSPINQFRLGKGSTIEEYSLVDNGVGDVIIGNQTRIGLRSTIIGPVQIGNHVILAQNVVVSGLNHRYEDTEHPIHKQGVDTSAILIGDDSWIGANSVITAGISIGKHVIVGAGSVVTKDIPDYCVVVGNPAKIIKRLDVESKKWIAVR
ncbi:acyltransferase [Bacteroides sp. GD17]|jgi:acetyltransferase-like isoleucine patch superfamily enzyme|uniref:acyltransferase n=1 Tax=Bacteroides sp. GD17 TaxID=3139826 RepID=UPI0025F4FE1C|nr:acyltransferase [uncultured Bacteroides sp.]